ncbi:MAG: GPR endopeptidase [Clostridia bacterium]|nr:GPR endopeptidase [Clostridia bacterium]
MKNIQRSDLACESYLLDDEQNLKNGIKTTLHSISNYQAIETEILNSYGESITGKKQGKYLTLCLGKIWQHSEIELEKAVDLIAFSLKKLFSDANLKKRSFLVVGLGNKRIISDALGPLTIEKMTPTAHLFELDRSLFNKFGYSLSLFEPKVSAISGQDSSELVLEISRLTKCACVILIDSLLSNSRLRLCKTVQVSNTGIVPGALRYIKKEITSELLALPVIAIGVPFAIAFESENELDKDEIFFSPYDVDIMVEKYSQIISKGIEKAISEFSNI